MARLIGPLFSLGASGAIGKALVFAEWKGIDYARQYVIPANPKSADQQEVRGVFTTLNNIWKRMPQLARDPWQAAVRGLALIDRNRHIQASALALKDQSTLDDLVMSVSSGSAVPPVNVVATPGVKTITITADAPPVPPGYTLTSLVGAAIKDGDPSPALDNPTFAAEDVSTPYSIVITTDLAGVHQWGCWAKWLRVADNKIFYSVAVRGQATTT